MITLDKEIEQMTPSQAWTALAEIAVVQPLLIARASEQNNGADRLLDVSEVAKRLDMSESRIYRMCREERLPFMMKVGGSWKGSERKLELWIARNGE